MKTKFFLFIPIFLGIHLFACTQNKLVDSKVMTMDSSKFNKLTPEEEYVIVKKGTERPFTGKYTDYKEQGIYTCKRCNAALYTSEDKFESHCGWPSFDDEIKGAIKRVPDPDGQRTEIICNNCGAHLGHVFEGEKLTDKNLRHCVNSTSMNFIPAAKTDTALFASGCFWGTEYHFEQLKGVISTQVGYSGGTKENPTYEEVSSGKTGHAETVEVIYDPSKVGYEELVKLFFETHDQSQVNRQGPDIGNQYRSAIFYRNEEQKKIAAKLIKELENKGYKVSTELTPASKFWEAENYHQEYYKHSGGSPYCHIYKKKFN